MKPHKAEFLRLLLLLVACQLLEHTEAHVLQPPSGFLQRGAPTATPQSHGANSASSVTPAPAPAPGPAPGPAVDTYAWFADYLNRMKTYKFPVNNKAQLSKKPTVNWWMFPTTTVEPYIEIHRKWQWATGVAQNSLEDVANGEGTELVKAPKGNHTVWDGPTVYESRAVAAQAVKELGDEQTKTKTSAEVRSHELRKQRASAPSVITVPPNLKLPRKPHTTTLAPPTTTPFGGYSSTTPVGGFTTTPMGTTTAGFGSTSMGFGSTSARFGASTSMGFGSTTRGLGFGSTTARFGSTTPRLFGSTTPRLGFGTTPRLGFGTTPRLGFGSTTMGFFTTTPAPTTTAAPTTTPSPTTTPKMV